MIRPAALDIRAGRHVPFDRSFAITGLNLTGATAAAQVRLTGDTAGTALITFSPTISVNTSGASPVSTIRLQATKTVMEGLPAAPEVGADAVLAWDLVVTTISEAAAVYLRGAFIVEAGVTQ
jgi:hypothetical protein